MQVSANRIAVAFTQKTVPVGSRTPRATKGHT